MREEPIQLLRAAVGNPAADFHPGQWEAIDALISKRARLLVVQRTGWGKSIVYFLATRLNRDQGRGCTLLISPLLALMRNQLEAAQRAGVRAETINSANPEDWESIKGALRAGQVDLLLVSPERLSNEEFVTDCLLPIAGTIGLFVVDEAHCISDWGHDFRPDYRRIVRILQALPRNVPVLATTATANERVVQDVILQLGPGLECMRGALTRESLRLQNLRFPTKAERMAWLAEVVPSLPGSGIIYTLTKHDADRVADWLRQRGIEAQAYHSDVEAGARDTLEQRLLNNQLKALVATVALGMGFDKPDLGFVIHFQRPASVVHYYQQVGRAGRAIDDAYGVLLSGAEDDDIAEYFIRSAFPTEEEVQDVLGALERSPRPLSVIRLQAAVNLTKSKIEKVLRFLEVESRAPVQKVQAGWVRSPVRWQMPHERINRITQLRHAEQARMQEYVSSRTCLMQFLAEELSDPYAQPCGKCFICTGQGLPTGYSDAEARLAVEFLKNTQVPLEPRKQWPGGVSFENHTGKIPEAERAEPGTALCRWGDPGYGDLVRTGKQQTGVFDDQLVAASVDLIRNRWQPQPQPSWVTCVPSRRHVTLVPDFAGRLAAALGIPFVVCIRKVRDTEPQKGMQNSAMRIANLDGAFEIDPRLIRPGPVFLVDDMVDSRWTFTVLAAKLRAAGVPAVFPFALASTATGDTD
jgi:ATP-dependent DNA helicase RecQ